MSTDKFIFKVHTNGQVERVKDCDNLTFSDVINGLGIAKNEIKCKPIKDSGIYAFYNYDKSDVLIFAIPERQIDHIKRPHEHEAMHGILASQFRMVSIPQLTSY